MGSPKAHNPNQRLVWITGAQELGPARRCSPCSMLPLLWPVAAALAAIVLISMLQRVLWGGAAPKGAAAGAGRRAAAARCAKSQARLLADCCWPRRRVHEEEP